MRKHLLPAGLLVFAGAASLIIGFVGQHNAAPLARSAARAPDREHEGAREESPVAEAFWKWRVSYPTGRFDAAWYDAAVAQHARIPRGKPGGANVRADSGGGHAVAKSLDGTRAANSSGVLDSDTVTALGPSPLDWSSTYGLVAGRVNVIVTHPAQSNVAWFGSDGGGVWKSTNCCGPATTWQVKTDLPQIANIAVDSLVLDPHDPDTLYAGTGDFDRNRPFAFGASGLLKSTDGGETWRVLATDVFNPVYTEPAGDFTQRRSVSSVAVDPNSSNNIVVGTSQGLYFSNNAGVDWHGPCFTNAFASQRQDITGLLAIAHGTSTQLLVAVGSLTAESTVRYDLGNNGANGIYAATIPTAGCPAPASWSVLSRPGNGWPAGAASGLPSTAAGGNPLGRIDLAVAPSDNRVLYAQVMYMGVWRSSDGGATWAQTAVPPQAFATGCQIDSYVDGIGFEDYNAGLLVDPTDPQTVFLSSIDLWRSTDGGRNFVDLTCGYDKLPSGAAGHVHVDNHARALVAGNSQTLLIGNDGGVYVSANAKSTAPDFVAINNSLNTIEFYSGDITAGFNDPNVATRGIVGGAQDNGTSNYVWTAGAKPGSARWSVVDDGDGIYAKIEPILGQRWYYSSQFGYITASIGGPAAPADQSVSPLDPNTFLSWQGDRTGFLTPYDLYKFGDESSCPAASGCQRMLAGTYRVWESLSGGLPSTSWYINSPDLTKNLAPDDASLSIINKVAFSYSDPSIAAVGTNDGNVWIGFHLGSGTTNSATWVNVTGNNSVLPNRPVMDVTSDPTSPTTVYAGIAGFNANTPGTPGHAFKLVCGANCATFSWQDKTGNLPDIPVNAILINPHQPKQAFAGTDWGLYFTDDIDASPPQWSRFDAGLPSAMIWGLTIDRGATTLAIFTRSRGAYVWPLAQAQAGANLDQHGLTGSWYNPATSGQGFEIEVYPDLNSPGHGLMFAGWFTYDAAAAGGRRWYGLQGDVSSTSATATLQIFDEEGGNLNAPPALGDGTARGQATLQFSDCNTGSLTYTFTDGSGRSGTIPMVRLTPDFECSPSGGGGSPASDYLLSGNWYSPDTSGQGLMFDFSPSIDNVFAAWYTFKPNGAQIGGAASQDWYTLQSSQFAPGTTSLDNIAIFENTGGVFNDPTPTTSVQVGVARIAFTSCSAMTLNYQFSAGSDKGRNGSIALRRVGPTPPGCSL